MNPLYTMWLSNFLLYLIVTGKMESILRQFFTSAPGAGVPHTVPPRTAAPYVIDRGNSNADRQAETAR